MVAGWPIDLPASRFWFWDHISTRGLQFLGDEAGCIQWNADGETITTDE
jgi:hypothetical protein